MITTYKPFVHNFICDVCREKRYSTEKRRDGANPGLIVCKRCYRRKHPNETIPKLPNDLKPVKDARPETEDLFRDDI